MAFLSLKEIENIIRNFLKTRGPKGASEEEIKQVVEELASMRINGLLADMIIKGEIPVHLEDGELKVGGSWKEAAP